MQSAETTAASAYVQYSEFLTEISLARDVRSFLMKNLLPLALLSLVTYISLFFSPDQAGTRISFAITSILTAAVLLAGISDQLPDVGYTVAIEWGFYAYIALSATLVLINIAVQRLYKNKRYKPSAGSTGSRASSIQWLGCSSSWSTWAATASDRSVPGAAQAPCPGKYG